MDEVRNCKHHGESIYRYYESQNRWRCLKCQTESTQRRRDNVKIKAVEYKGGKCSICGYDKCIGALEFHHLDPDEKIPNVNNPLGWSVAMAILAIESFLNIKK